MTALRSRALVATSLALLAGALLWLHGAVLRYPFIADDYYFLWETRDGSAASLFGGLEHRPNYYRPLGREIYFRGVGSVFGEDPRAFHALGFVLLVGLVAGVGALGGRLSGPRAGVLAAAVYALFYPHRVSLGWVSCAQDLLSALLAVTAALAFSYGRRWLAAGAYFLALFAKESVAPLPVILLAIELLPQGSGRAAAPRGGKPARRRLPDFVAALRRTGPLWIAACGWAVLVLLARALSGAWNTWHGGLAVADVRPGPESVWLGLSRGLETLLYVDQPLRDLLPALREHAPPWIAITLVATVAFLAARLPRAPLREPAGLAWGGVWLAIGLLPVALVGHLFSAYYVSFAAVGFALLAGPLLARLKPMIAALVLAFAAFLNAGANATDLFREREDRPGVSQLSAARLDRAATYLEALRAVLDRRRPPRGTVVYLARMPNYVGFATAQDRALWVWTGDSTVHLTVIGNYRRGGGGPPARHLRYDEQAQRFVELPHAMVDQALAGEEALAAGRPADAKRSLLLALALARPGDNDADRVEFETGLGLACWRSGDPAGALEAWQRALKLDSKHHDSLMYRALAQTAMGDQVAARQTLERLLALYPEDPQARAELARIQVGSGR